MKAVEINVGQLDVSSYCSIALDTVNQCEGELIKREKEEEVLNDVGYKDIGGGSRQLVQVKEMVELSSKHLYLFQAIGVKPARGISFDGLPCTAEKFVKFGMSSSLDVFIHGSLGYGKTLPAKAIANEWKVNCISITGRKFSTMFFGESESNVRDVLDKVRVSGSCVLFPDELDSVVMSRGGNVDYPCHAVDSSTYKIYTVMNGLGTKKSVFIISGSNKPDTSKSATLRSDLLDQLIYIPVRSEKCWMFLLEANLRMFPVVKGMDLNVITTMLDEFSGVNVNEICQRRRRVRLGNDFRRYELFFQILQPCRRFLKNLNGENVAVFVSNFGNRTDNQDNSHDDDEHVYN